MTSFPRTPAELIALTNMELQRAGCAGKSPLFDDHVHGETALHRAYRHHRARQICRTCPIIDRCQAAFEELPKSQQYGMWAGRLYSRRSDRKKIA